MGCVGHGRKPSRCGDGVSIREAVEGDIPALVEMGSKFHGMATDYHALGRFDEEAVARVLRFMIANPSCLIVTNGEGAIGGTIVPVFFAPTNLSMEENFWWAAKGGMELLAEFERRAESMGATAIFLSTLENDRSDTFAKILARKGYRLSERRYMKGLS